MFDVVKLKVCSSAGWKSLPVNTVCMFGYRLCQLFATSTFSVEIFLIKSDISLNVPAEIWSAQFEVDVVELTLLLGRHRRSFSVCLGLLSTRKDVLNHWEWNFWKNPSRVKKSRGRIFSVVRKNRTFCLWRRSLHIHLLCSCEAILCKGDCGQISANANHANRTLCMFTQTWPYSATVHGFMFVRF